MHFSTFHAVLGWVDCGDLSYVTTIHLCPRLRLANVPRVTGTHVFSLSLSLSHTHAHTHTVVHIIHISHHQKHSPDGPSSILKLPARQFPQISPLSPFIIACTSPTTPSSCFCLCCLYFIYTRKYYPSSKQFRDPPTYTHQPSMQQKVPFSLIRCSSSKVAFCSCVE